MTKKWFRYFSCIWYWESWVMTAIGAVTQLHQTDYWFRDVYSPSGAKLSLAPALLETHITKLLNRGFNNPAEEDNSRTLYHVGLNPTMTGISLAPCLVDCTYMWPQITTAWNLPTGGYIAAYWTILYFGNRNSLASWKSYKSLFLSARLWTGFFFVLFPEKLGVVSALLGLSSSFLNIGSGL